MKRAAEALIEFGATGFGTQVGIPTDLDDDTNQYAHGNCFRRSLPVEEYLNEAGVRRVVSSGDPSGQLPTIVRHPNSGLLWLTCDLSNSDRQASKLFNPASSRSNCFAIVTCQGQYLSVEGESNKGSTYGFKLHNDPDKDQNPFWLVGRQLTSGAWVQAVKDKDRTVVARGSRDGKVVVEDLTPEKAGLKMKQEYGWGVLKPFAVPMSKIRANTLVDSSFHNRDYKDFRAGDARRGDASEDG